MPSSKASRVLVLSQDFQPHMLVSWEKAFVLLTTPAPRDREGKIRRGPDGLPMCKAYDIAWYDEEIHTSSQTFRAPAVIVLTTNVTYRRHKRKFSRKGVYQRDKYTCQYCRKVFASDDLTLDHVIPASRGGRLTWGNTVAACLKCNQRKRDRTPAEAGMDVGFNNPVDPKFSTFCEIHDITRMPEEWVPYLPTVTT